MRVQGHLSGLAAAGLCVAALVATSSADTATWTSPDFDSRTYPFVGQRSLPSEPVFGFNNVPDFVGSFDSRDSQIQVGFDTASKGIPTGAALDDYEIVSVSMTITAATPVGAPEYDPTYDDVSTYALANGPAPAPDADAGRPITLFGLGFRNGYTALEFGTPTLGPPLFGESGEGYGPSSFGIGIRHAFAIDFDDDGFMRDVSANLDEPNLGANAFNPNYFAIGTTTTVTPGLAYPPGTVFTFDIDLSDPDILGYVRQSLEAGQLGLAIATLNPASGGPGGGGGGDYPFFYMSENGSNAATMEIVYQIPPSACVGDIDGDGDTDVFDFGLFAPAFGTSLGDAGFVPAADLNNDSTIDVFDFGIFAPDFGCMP